jgi:hypothetical protein
MTRSSASSSSSPSGASTSMSTASSSATAPPAIPDASPDAPTPSSGSADAEQPDGDANVGECDSACSPAQLCTGGACICPTVANPDACGSICTNKESDPQNCGACNNMCTGGTVCEGGACQCSGGAHLCAGACVPNDANACGPNCTPCIAGQGCFAGTCRCISGAGCPALAPACNTSSHTCSSSCDGVTSICNGGCCSNGTCQPGNVYGACGAGGGQCATSCQLDACDTLPEWGGGSCECGNNDDSYCTGVPTGPRCVPPGDGQECGCLSDADCPSSSCNLVNQSYGYCD